MNKVVEINPFVVNNPIEVICINGNKKVPESSDSVDSVSYEKSGSSLYYIEQQRKVSLYKHHNYKINDVLFGRLSNKGRDMFLYILCNMPENKDYINLKLSSVRESSGMSRNAIIYSLKELCQSGILAVKEQSVYWVNPFYIFNGNRIKYYRSIGEQYINTVSMIKK